MRDYPSSPSTQASASTETVGQAKSGVSMDQELGRVQVNAQVKGGGFVETFFAWATHNPLGFKGALLLLAFAFSLALTTLWADVFKSFDERSDYWTWNLKTQASPERRLVVVDIDEKSVQALGSWPWPRQTMADLVRALNQEGAGLKMFDIVFPESKTGDYSLQAALREGAPNVGGQIFSINPQVLARSGVVSSALSGTVSGSPSLSKSGELGSTNAQSSGPCPASAQAAFGFIGNAAELTPSFAQVGHLTPIIDPDGAVRQVPAMVCFEGNSYPSLSLAALMQVGESAIGNPVPSKAVTDQGVGVLGSTASKAGSAWVVKGESWWQAPWSIKLRNWPDFSWPMNEQGQVRVSYRTPRAQFVSLSASDVLAHRVPQDLLKGAWVLVGSTAFGAGDAIPTPHGGAEGGLEVHAQLIAAALDQATPYTPMGSMWLQSAVVVMFALLLLALSVLPSKVGSTGSKRANGLHHPSEGDSESSRLEVLQNALGLGTWNLRERWVFVMPLAGLALMAGCFGLHAWNLLEHNWWLGWTAPAFTVFLSALAFTVGDLGVLRWQRTRLYENLARYVSEPIARDVALLGARDTVEAQEEQVVVLAVNVRNFDRFCDSMTVARSAAFLHDYLNLLSTQVGLSGGELHHVQGTQALAVWRLGVEVHNAPAKVTEQAVSLSQLLWRASQTWSANSDQAELELEMGLETGSALVGSMGPGERRFHAVLGEPVVVAQALREMAAELAYPVLLGPNVAQVLKMSENSALSTDRENTDAMTRSAPIQTLDSFSTLRLGEFLLPGTAEARVVFASLLDMDDQRLRLVDTQALEQRVA